MARREHIIRGTSALLTVIVLLFTIGVPIVVSSCPMSKPSQRAVCDQCPSGTRGNGLSVGRNADRSCCATVFAAGRNTTEYLLLSQSFSVVVHHVHLLPPEGVNVSAAPRSLAFVSLHSPPPPPCEDIPLFVSALLI